MMKIAQRLRQLEQERPAIDDGWCHCPRPMTIQRIDYRLGLEALMPGGSGIGPTPICERCGKQNGLQIRAVVDPKR